MATKSYGIDFGTYAVKIYKIHQGVRFHQKSVIATRDKGNVIAIGEEAYSMIGKEPEYIHIDRPIQNGVIANFDTMLSLMNCISMDMGRDGDKLKGATFLVAVPTEVTDVEKKTFYDIIDSSIIRPKKIRITEKPLADAIGCGIDIANSNGSLVVDIGADTTEISVISQGGIVLSRLCPYGGYRFDEAIIAAVRRKYNLLIGITAAEELKKNIGCVMQRPDMGIEEVKGRNLANGLPKTVRVSSNELIEAFVEPMNDILEAIHAVLERTPPQLVGDLDQNGIIISGGGSLVYGMDRLIERSTGIRTIPVDDPVSCATYGAGKMLKHLDEMQDGMMNFHRMRQLK